jgi:hypothetical protein
VVQALEAKASASGPTGLSQGSSIRKKATVTAINTIAIGSSRAATTTAVKTRIASPARRCLCQFRKMLRPVWCQQTCLSNASLGWCEWRMNIREGSEPRHTERAGSDRAICSGDEIHRDATIKSVVSQLTFLCLSRIQPLELWGQQNVTA